MGLYQAGFEVVGVDNIIQPRYPFEFIQADALQIDLTGYDAYWASPPCQYYSEATPVTTKKKHPNLIRKVHDLLIGTGKPYVIENVEGARWHLQNPIMLCGTMFGLGVWRHRWFEVYPCYFLSPFSCNHNGHPVTVNPPANARKAQGGRNFEKEQIAMGINWMNKQEISQAVPPAFSEYIGKKIIKCCYS